MDVGIGKQKVDVCVTFFNHEARGGNVSPVDLGESQTAPFVPHLQVMESYSSFDTHMSTATQDTQELGNSMVSGYAGGEGELNTQINNLQSSQELLNGLRDQYLQALYISKVSVSQPWTKNIADIMKDIPSILCKRPTITLSYSLPIY